MSTEIIPFKEPRSLTGLVAKPQGAGPYPT